MSILHSNTAYPTISANLILLKFVAKLGMCKWFSSDEEIRNK